MLKRLKTIALNFLYNVDRTVASVFGAPPEETISSEIGRHMDNPVAHVAGELLDKIDPNHVEDAVSHADALEAMERR
jgi:hypothetical protein